MPMPSLRVRPMGADTMFEATRTNLQLLGAAIVLNLVLALVVGVAVMSRPLDLGMVLAEASAGASPGPGASPVLQWEPGPLAVVVTQPGGLMAAPPPAGSLKVTGAAFTSATSSSGAPASLNRVAYAAPTDASPAAVAPVAPGPAPRVEPSKAAIRAVINELDARTNFIKPTESQIREAGDKICTAFDQKYSYAQVKQAVLDAAKQAPYLGVSSDDAEYSVMSAVGLFCPAHQGALR